MRTVLLLASFVCDAFALASQHRTSNAIKQLEARQSRADITYTSHTIDQPIDHAEFHNSSRYAPHTNDTFKQRYVFDSSYYKPGGPVFLYIGGETSVESRFSNLQTGIIQILMNATNGLGVILENRYYGKSFPYNDSSTDHLRFLTTEQTIADNAYFARHAVFPGVNGSLSPQKTPWILYGGSLAGAQTAYSLKTYEGLLWGGIAASGTTKGKLGAEEWYDPIQKYGPQDCVGSLNGIVDKIDEVFEGGNATQIHHMKSIFGLEALTDNGDFAQTIAYPIGGPFNYPTSTWQELNWNSTYGSDDFFLFCNNITNPNAPENITQVDYALANYTRGESWPNLGNYANYIKNIMTPAVCTDSPSNGWGLGPSIEQCFGYISNQSYWADPTSTSSRSYTYSFCTEQGTYIAARQNSTQPSLISRVLTPAYTQKWCRWAFPHDTAKYNKIDLSGPNLELINKYGGYNVSAPRLAHIDGNQDVWLFLCYHSEDAPKRFTRSMEDAYLHPQLLITGAGHHWDSYGILDVEAEPQFIREAHKWEIRIVEKWIEMFREQKNATGY